MFNVRPDALSPWLYVEQPAEDEPPGFRVAPDGSVIDAKSSTSSAPVAPTTDTDFENAIRLTAGGLYGPADLAMLPRDRVQEAIDQIGRIYAGFGIKPASLLDRQAPSADMTTPVGSRPISPHAIGSLLSSPPSSLVNPMSHVEGGRLPMVEASFGSPSGNIPQTDPQFAPSPSPESQQAPDDKGRSLPWLPANLPSQPGNEPLLGRISSGAEPMSLPVPTANAGIPSAVFDDGIGVRTTPADDVQIAQAPPRPQQRTQKPTPSPKKQEPDPPASEQKLQVNANTQFVRANTWEDVIRQPLPEKIDPRFQQPLPDDWEAAVNKIDPNYLKWTKAAAEKYGIPPELLARLLNKESNYDRNMVSPRGARGIAQLMPDAVKDLGFDQNTFDYFNAEKSINAGAAFLSKYYAHFKDWPKAVAAYNWGIGNLHNWLEGNKRVGPDDETQTMLKHVFRGDPHAFNKKP